MMRKLIAIIPAVALSFAVIGAQAQDGPIEGAVVSSDGQNVLLRVVAVGNVNITINNATKIEMAQGLVGRVGLAWESSTSDALVPGLRVKVDAASSGNQMIAKIIRFSGDDLQRVNEIQAALQGPRQQIAALADRVRAQEQVIANQEKQIAHQEKQIAANRQSIVAAQTAADKRFSDLAEYDVKSESTILFEVNSAALSDKAKQDLRDLAARAKTFSGYLIQVAGYADSDGGASLNQNLSDRRAEAVANYLRQECDVGMSRVLAPVAMSSARAVASNETARGKAENRRVVVKIAVNRGISPL